MTAHQCFLQRKSLTYPYVTQSHTHTRSTANSHTTSWNLPSAILSFLTQHYAGGLGLREGVRWIESYKEKCKSTGITIGEVPVFSLLMLWCQWIKWELYCVLHLWWLENKSQCLTLGWLRSFSLDDSITARYQHTVALTSSCWKLQYQCDCGAVLVCQFFLTHMLANHLSSVQQERYSTLTNSDFSLSFTYSYRSPAGFLHSFSL